LIKGGEVLDPGQNIRGVQGIVADVISTDSGMVGRTFNIHGLTECMSKFQALGLGIEDVIRITTANPARVLGMSDTLGAIAVGQEVDST
jgi:dihydroorotase